MTAAPTDRCTCTGLGRDPECPAEHCARYPLCDEYPCPTCDPVAWAAKRGARALETRQASIVAPPRRPLPEKAQRYLDRKESHPNGSWATLVSLANYFRAAGRDAYDFEDEVSESEFGQTSSLFDGGRLGAQCARAWERTDDDAETTDADGVRRLVAELHQRVTDREWRGRTGLRDRDVALAILERCHELGTYSPVVSARWLAERVSRGHTTVARALTSLRGLGFLSGKPQVTGQGNRRYKVNLRWERSTKPQDGTSNLVRSTCITMRVQVGHDAFVSRALGPLAGQVWFRYEPVTAAQVAAEYGVSDDTARRALKGLAEFGLATKGQGRPATYTMLDASVEGLDEIARWFRTDGWHERQAESHARQRGARSLHFETRG